MATESSSQRRAASAAEAKALASPIRIRILRVCMDEPMTNKQIAERLELNPATVLHHVRTLVDTGFLQSQDPRRGPRGSREVPYLATGKSWRVNLEGDVGAGRAMLDAFLAEAALVDPDQVPFARLGLRLTDEEYAELRVRLMGLLNEYAERPGTPSGKPYSLFVALHEDVSRRSAESD